MPNIVVIAHLPFVDDDARDTALEKLIKISDSAKENEPDVLRYFFSKPREETDGKSLYVVEEYTSQAAIDAHMNSQPVAEMMEYLTENPQILKGKATVNSAESHASFTRAEIKDADDPWICCATIEYKEGKRAVALEPWKWVTSETQKNEAKTLSYSILKDSGHPETVRTVEVYADQEYFKEVHVPSKAVQEVVKNYGSEIRVSLKHVFLKYEGGFMGR